MPLSNLQTEILRTLSAQRNPESYVAGSTPLNRNAARFSGDIDVFHDNEDSLAASAFADAQTIDLVTIHENILPLGAVVWAAVEKSPGFTPEGLIAEIRRNSNFPSIDWNALVTSVPIDPRVTTQRIRSILDEAEAFVTRMPSAKAGLLFLKDGNVVQPDPDQLDQYQTHAGQRRGQWPSSPEITNAMFDHYR